MTMSGSSVWEMSAVPNSRRKRTTIRAFASSEDATLSNHRVLPFPPFRQMALGISASPWQPRALSLSESRVKPLFLLKAVTHVDTESVTAPKWHPTFSQTNVSDREAPL
jgi:hypothetical protein